MHGGAARKVPPLPRHSPRVTSPPTSPGHSMKTTAGIALLVLCAACAGSAPRTEPPPDRNTITREQLAEHHFRSAYDAVAALRRNWLETRGPDSFSTPSQVLVYIDNVRVGGVETLRSIAISSISSIQHFDGLAASARWGLDHGAGVILVSTQTGPPRRPN